MGRGKYYCRFKSQWYSSRKKDFFNHPYLSGTYIFLELCDDLVSFYLCIREISVNYKIFQGQRNVREFSLLSEKKKNLVKCLDNGREFFSFEHGGNKCVKV